MQRLLTSIAACCLAVPTVWAQDTDQLAKQLSNPIASLISVPFQLNDEHALGPSGEGRRARLNIQPVVPMSISDDWNLISRSIVPLIRQRDVFPGQEQSGTGDVLQSLFFSPKALTPGGWSWGIGPVLLLPTASEDELGGGKWGAGPTLVAVRQTASGWTYGALVNHVASFAGDADRTDINATFLQPFVAKRIGRGRTVSANFESTYDWQRDAWSAPLNVSVSQIVPINQQLLSFQAGAAWFTTAPRGAPEWGWRFTVTLLYPRY